MLDIRYVAGLFDGEGCISVTVGGKGTYKGYSEHYRRYQLHVGIGMTFKPLVTELHEQFNGGISSVFRHSLAHRRCYYWKLSSDPAASFLRSLLPFLHVKKEEAELAIELQEHIRKFCGRTRKNPELATEIYAHRQKLVDRMRVVKRPTYPSIQTLSN